MKSPTIPSKPFARRHECLFQERKAIRQYSLPEGVEAITRLGYPAYFLTILGVWKILGVVALLVPKFLLLKEWAYAGFFFVTSGALFSHITMGDPVNEIFPSLLLLILTVLS